MSHSHTSLTWFQSCNPERFPLHHPCRWVYGFGVDSMSEGLTHSQQWRSNYLCIAGTCWANPNSDGGGRVQNKTTQTQTSESSPGSLINSPEKNINDRVLPPRCYGLFGNSSSLGCLGIEKNNATWEYRGVAQLYYSPSLFSPGCLYFMVVEFGPKGRLGLTFLPVLQFPVFSLVICVVSGIYRHIPCSSVGSPRDHLISTATRQQCDHGGSWYRLCSLQSLCRGESGTRSPWWGALGDWVMNVHYGTVGH